MGRPEPCVLFAQTFVHPVLDEYSDEVLFAEPVVITACEVLEQNASSTSPVLTLLGATSPSSFALEVFAHYGEESRFRRLGQSFLYSQSSSNVLEIEAVVTNHLVVRGTYRSLTLVVYGNTAEGLGQFNIDLDLDSSLANLVSSPSEGKLEDLPPPLHSPKSVLEEPISPLKSISLAVAESDLSLEMEQFLQLIIKIFGASVHGDAMDRVIESVVLAASSYMFNDLGCTTITWNESKLGESIACMKEPKSIFTEAKNELQELYKILQYESSSTSVNLSGEGSLEDEAGVVTTTTELLADVFSWYYLFIRKCRTDEFPFAKNKSTIIGLSLALLLCSGRHSCFHFVNGGGMEQLAPVFHDETQKSSAVMLMLLGVIERGTRHAIGCEGFLGWWPREDETVPLGSSEGYSQLLKLLLQKQRHDISSLATYVLHRLHIYEVASRYESAVLALLGGLSAVSGVTHASLDILVSAKLQLKKLLKLVNSRGPIEDPLPVARAKRSLILGQNDGLLSYKATVNLIASSKCSFSVWDIDPHVLSLLKERGFLPLSAALLSSTSLRLAEGHTMNLFAEIASLIEAILLSLLLCRSGPVFLLLQPEVTVALIHALEGVEDGNKECVPLRYASVLLSKGFLCHPRDVGIITEQHLRVVRAIDHLLTSTSQSEELLWILWELCGLSRSDSGRQALLTLGHFPEAVKVLMEALKLAKEVEPGSTSSGTSPLNLAICHLAAELFEVVVTDTTASSLASWIEHAVELHKALHSSSPGSNRKDAPTRLLELVDAGVVYHKSGAIGLLHYAAGLASGGDAHLTSTTIAVPDSMEVENVVGDSASASDVQGTENLLGKLVSDKYFEGLALGDSSIAQLTTAFRILAFISENSSVATALYEGGAVTLIYVVLLNCKFLLEQSSNTYDYLVDEGAECNSMSDLLLERGREQSLVDLMIPCLGLLIALLHRLQESKEQHRNTKLLNALLILHREVSPKLAACVADLSSPYPSSALNLGAVCNLLVSAVACWPVFDWTPDLFDCLLKSMKATSLIALGPKEACSMLFLLGDLFPEEGIWLWKYGMPSFCALRKLAIGTLMGPEQEKQVDWYLQPEHVATLLSRLIPYLEDIAGIILHLSFTSVVIVQDMLRVFIIRIACQKSESANELLRPIFSWLHDRVSESSPLSDTDVFKVYKLLDFIASLLEHPCAKIFLVKDDFVGILVKALEKCSFACISDEKAFTDSRNPSSSAITVLAWCLPLFKSVALICDSQTSLRYSRIYDEIEKLSVENCTSILYSLLKLCKVLQVGNELLASLIAFKELASSSEGRHACMSISIHVQSTFEESLGRGHEQDEHDGILDKSDWRKHPPLLYCCRNVVRSIERKDGFSTYAVEAVGALSLGALCLSMEGKSINLAGVSVLKCLFGIPVDLDGMEHCPEEKLKDVSELIGLLDLMVVEDKELTSSSMKATLLLIKEMVKLLLLLLQKPMGLLKGDDAICNEVSSVVSSYILDHSKGFPPRLMCSSVTMASFINDDAGSSFLGTRKSDGNFEKTEDICSLGGLADKFLWDCPDSFRGRSSLSALPAKRKLASVETPSRRPRGDNPGGEITGPNAFARGVGPLSASFVPTRRDTFRQRKANTSRPPSIHVDDYVARNFDGSGSSNVVSSGQRGGSTGGRAPSIHVDEFMARQRDCQIPMAGTVVEASHQASNVPPDTDMCPEKVDRSRQLKAGLDDDLQEINIVFDGEESESDEGLPFLQPDDSIQHAPVIAHPSVVEESESDSNGSTQNSNLIAPSASNASDGNTPNEFSPKRSVFQPEMPLSHKASISSENKFPGTNMQKPFSSDLSDHSTHSVPIVASREYDVTGANVSGLSPSLYKGSASSGHSRADTRMPPPTYYQRNSPRQAPNFAVVSGSQRLNDQKLVSNQPPLPPYPPPPNVSRVASQNSEIGKCHSPHHSIRDIQPPLPPFPPPPNVSRVASQYSEISKSHTPPYSHSIRDIKPPLPLTSYSPPQLVPMLPNTRSASIPVDHFSSPPQQQGQNQSLSQTVSTPQPSVQSVQSRPQLQPPLPPHPHPQQFSPSILVSLQQAEVSLLQTPMQVQGNQFQIQPQSHISPIQIYYQPQQQDQPVHSNLQQQVEHTQSQALPQQRDNAPQQQQEQQDPGLSLHQYLNSREAITSLLSDRDKLCQLLEQHPKLMQMLQEKLGQL